MKSDTEKALSLLRDGNYTCVLCKDGKVFTCTDRGVKPLLDFIDAGAVLKGFCAADKVVGKAAAFLYEILCVEEVYADVMSESAEEVFAKAGIKSFYASCVPLIRNRDNTGFCPMETAVKDADDAESALALIKEKLQRINEGR